MKEFPSPGLEFKQANQNVSFSFSNQLHGVPAITVGGWFFLRLKGEQYLFHRGVPEIGLNGDRLFPRQEKWVNFLLGTDQRGFLMGVINGNSYMPFPQVSISEVAFDEWSQLVVVKTESGHHKLYHNGALVHSDLHSVSAGKNWPFLDQSEGENLTVSVPQGGIVGEVWIFARELTKQEIARDFAEKRTRYSPALPVKPVALREMNLHPQAHLWPAPITKQSWPRQREELLANAHLILGVSPKEKAPLAAKIESEEDCGTYLRRKVSIQVQPGDRMPFYLLIPKNRKEKLPAILCFYGTSSGAGKETTVGLSGRAPGSKPHPNMAFAVDMAEAGFVAVAADYLRDGERILPGKRPYDTTDFYNEFPDWSIHGKDAWDSSRLIDYLETLDFVDATRVGMTGHSYGGHSTIFTTAIEPRIKTAVANGPVSDFLHHGLHWAVPKGAGNSQSMPNLRPYILDRTKQLPITFYGFTALIAPRPLLVGQAAGERRPFEEENYAAVKQVYDALGIPNLVRYHWYAGDHDYPPEARKAAVEWFKKYL